MELRILALVVLATLSGCQRAEYSGPCKTDADCDDDNVCTSDFCTTGECHHTNFPDGLQCDDGDLCTTDDACASGQCQGASKSCGEFNGPCTQGACESATGECGSVPKPDGTDCNDGQYCTENDACQAGVCTGEARDCSDTDDCTLDSCNEADEQCDHINQPQPGAERNSLGDTCSNGVDDDCDGLTDDQDPNCGTCTTDAECDDGSECTEDTCVAQECQNSPVDDGTECDDTRFCTTGDVCLGGVCTGAPRDCSEKDDECNQGICSESAKTCEGQPLPDGTQCDDGFYCTVGDSCQEGVCFGSARDCRDSDICTQDVCVEEFDRCDHTLQPNPGAEGPPGDPTCSNGIDDDCDGSTDGEDGNCFDCQGDPDCDDHNTCTSDRCVSGECQNSPVTDGTDCDDGHYCTVTDICNGGICIGSPRDCRDGDNCTEDICDENNETCINTWVERPEETEICGDEIDQDCDGMADGCCLGTGAFETKTDYNSNREPYYIVAGDFDCDGILDLAVTAAYLDKLNVFLGNGSEGRGDGTFAAKTDYDVDASPRGIATGDFNQDGVLDLVLAAGGGNVLQVFLGDGDGTFTWCVDVATGAYPISVVAADFNADGILDLAATQRDTHRLGVFMGNADGGEWDGTFASRVDNDTGSYPWGLAAADFNADGILDLAVTNEDGESVSVLLGNGSDGVGDGSFRTKVDYTTGGSPRSVAVGDFNADGILDMAVSNDFSGDVSVLLGNGNDGKGNGSFAPKQDYTAGSTPWQVIARDFDQDGMLDLAVTNQSSNTVGILRGKGKDGRGDGTFANMMDYTTGIGPMGIAAGDFDADGILDLAVANNDETSVSVLLGAGSGARPLGAFGDTGGPATGQRPNYVAAADFNKDGILDLATANLGEEPGIGSVNILLGQGVDGRGDGTFTSTASLVQGDTPGSLVVGDFDADSIPDLAVANRVSDTVSIFLGNGSGGRGDGSFTHHADHMLTDSPFGIARGDFNGDKILDLVVTGYFDDTVSVMLGTGSGGRGDGGFPDQTLFDTGAGPYSLAVADFNRDNISDLAVANSDADTVSILLGNGFAGKGNGTFADKVDYDTGDNPRMIAVGDLDSDGILDLVTGNFGGGSVSVLLGLGDGTFGTKQDTHIGGRIGAVALADVDGDAILDLVAANYDYSEVSVLLGNGSNGRGDGSFGTKTDYATGDTPTWIAFGDFNADGVFDLAVTSKFDNRVNVLMGQRQCLAP